MSDHPSFLSPATGRREFLALGIGAFVVAAIPGVFRDRRRVFRRRIPVMGTIADIAVVAGDMRRAHEAMDAACGELVRVDRTMTRFDDGSDIGRLNGAAASTAVTVRLETAAVIHEALRWAEASDGAFDPCVGRVTALWDVGHRHAPPDARRVRRLAGRRLHRALDVDVKQGCARARITDRDAAVDLGGIAKGWAVDRAATVLRERGITGALVNVGGDLVAIGTDRDGSAWRVGIRSPENPDSLVATVDVRDAAVATSGDYEQFFEHGGRRYHHLLDPATGAPRTCAARSITIMASTCMAADAAATAIFGMPPGRADDLLRRASPGSRVIREA